jgi:hypothetical protein
MRFSVIHIVNFQWQFCIGQTRIREVLSAFGKNSLTTMLIWWPYRKTFLIWSSSNFYMKRSIEILRNNIYIT